MPRPKTVPPTAKVRADIVEEMLTLEEHVSEFMEALDENDGDLSWAPRRARYERASRCDCSDCCPFPASG